MNINSYPFYFVSYYAPDGDPTPEPAKKDPPDPTPDPEKPILSQKQFDNAMAKEKRAWQAKHQETINALEELKKNKSLTEKERDDLQTRIDDLGNQLLSKEEIARRDKEKLETDYKKQLETTSGEATAWKNQYTSMVINHAIMSAATEAKAFYNQQIVDLLAGKTRLAEVLGDDGKPTGDYRPVVKFDDLDKDGKPTTLDMSLPDVLKRMKELPEKYGNLFESGLNGGLGGSREPRTGVLDVSKMSHAEYRKNRTRIKEGQQ